MQPKLDEVAVPLWESILVKKGQTLELSYCLTGARAYIAFSGSIQSQLWLGSKSTFHKAAVGGIDGRAIQEGQRIALGISNGKIGKKIKHNVIPEMSNNGIWEIEVVKGPNDDWLDDNGYQTFLDAKWKLQARSDRTGFGLEVPSLRCNKKATHQ